MNFFYNTIEKSTEALLVEKHSKFHAFAFPVNSESETKQCLTELKNMHPKATHHCYAWRLGVDKMNYRANDDGEPSGTAGRPILGQIDSAGITNTLVVVVRYYGGTKLGASGLISAYKTAASIVLKDCIIVEKELCSQISIVCTYTEINDVMNFLKKNGINEWTDAYHENCELSFLTGNSSIEFFTSWLENHNFAFEVKKQ